MSDNAQAPSGPDLERGAPLGDIPEGGVLAGHVGDEPALLSRSGERVFAVAGACTHYGGPLAEGLVEGGKVHCPWHHACFDLKTGEALAAPAFAPLQTWRVEIEGGVAFVRELVLPRCSRLFRGPRLRLRISELLLPSVSIGPELGCHFTLAAQSFDRFVLCQLRMADLCLQIVRDGLHVR